MSPFEPPRVDGRDYEEIVREFRWRLPSRFNLGTCVDRHPAGRLGLLYLPGAGGEARRYTFGELAAQSNRVANLLSSGLGLERGARVARRAVSTAGLARDHVPGGRCPYARSCPSRPV